MFPTGLLLSLLTNVGFFSKFVTCFLNLGEFESAFIPLKLPLLLKAFISFFFPTKPKVTFLKS